jgi:hypothetical protein
LTKIHIHILELDSIFTLGRDSLADTFFLVFIILLLHIQILQLFLELLVNVLFGHPHPRRLSQNHTKIKFQIKCNIGNSLKLKKSVPKNENIRAGHLHNPFASKY